MLFSPQFQAAIAFTLTWEGTTLEHDPNDPGGTTFAGIDQASHPDVDVASLTLDDAKAIYWHSEWQWCMGDLLPASWATIVFDAAVNPGRAVFAWLQAAVGAKADGIIGPATIAALETAGPREMGIFLDRCEAYYRHLVSDHPAMNRYLSGWLNRNNARRALIAKS